MNIFKKFPCVCNCFFLPFNRMMEEQDVTVGRSAQIFRNFLYKYRDSLSASVLIAGYDDVEGGQVSVNYEINFTVFNYIEYFRLKLVYNNFLLSLRDFYFSCMQFHRVVT